MTTFDKFSLYCMTKPNSGFDAISMKTTAEDNGDQFLLNGEKAFISEGGESDIYIIMIRIGTQEIGCFIVEGDTKKLSFGKSEDKMGWNVNSTRAVILED